MSGRSNRGPGPVPERWLRCPRKSATLLINKFLIFKTPLNHRFDDQVPCEYRFPVEFVFDSMKSYKVKVGLWIDLTNTTRFYDKSEIEENDCRYVKMQCKGHGQTPTEDQSRAFTQVCKNFIKQHPLEVIGVHCTHGFNRSGFLLASYLIEILDWDLDAALAEFAKVRPPGIYKKDYLLELYKRYDDVQYAPDPPQLPDWCFDYDDSVGDEPDDGDDGAESSSSFEEETVSHKRKASDQDNNTSSKKRKKEFIKKNPKFMEGINNVEPVSEPLLSVIQQRVQDMCGWKRNGFPGCQPVSMDVNNMKLLAEKPYRVSWKADGVRYLMYIKGKDEVYCIDRDNCVFQVKNLVFPFKKDLNARLKDTLLDGEMVMDKERGQNTPRYLVYDIIYVLGYSIKNEPFFPKRYQAIELEVVEPRYKAMKKGMIDKMAEPFSVRSKQFLDVKEAFKFLHENFCKTLLHEPDGLIFQPSSDPYTSGSCPSVLKWKPASLNSVDFKLKISMEDGMGILPKKIGKLYVGGMEHPFDRLGSIKNLAHLDNKIIECKFENKKWVFMRERTDKSHPNSFETAKAVCESIRVPVTKEMLLHFIETQRYIDPMPPPSGPPPRHRSSHH